ncbi:sugar phosphate nucleotidyltransferase [Luteipulveratus sp. YIM 133132]|uniref:glucose-1-phosphate adenylyltransferase family protein n=1 Tax=Luteipulveratus flavus TaxID=3031728 RepID=UPI0023B13DC3|nr:sugar phosphate nucleotidyltransferase [Luteipulveratus sp. YIM 133132]MDE9365808.1 sugar phosphate nucleotidyltransferase [Luteipulveratus sp. YIM 133132]
MDTSRCLAVVQAGGQGSRMEVLTRERAKPALPFAGSYQLVDFPLSNLHHSGIDRVWLCLQYQADSLHDVVANGRPWDLDRTRGGLRLVFPQEEPGSAEDHGFATGNADQLFRIRADIGRAGMDAVLVMSADHVYQLDYTEVLRTHLDAGAECTVVTTTCGKQEASSHATVVADDRGRVSDIAYKPEKPPTTVIATEVFVYDAALLVQALEELQSRTTHDAEDGDTGLGDFGEHLLPWFVDRGKTVAHAMDGYWMDVGRPETYLQAHRDLIEGHVDVFRADRPVLTQQPQRAPAWIAEGSTVVDGLVSNGCRIEGTVRRSVLGPGVVVERGAEVTDSVIFRDTVVRAGARVSWSIVDEEVVVGRDASVGGRPRGRPVESERITLVGARVRVTGGHDVPLGARVEPGRRV